LLLLLSDVEGLYDRPPEAEGAQLIPHVDGIDSSVEALAHDRLGGLSKGGMASKLAAARMVTEAGGNCVIACGRRDDVLEGIFSGESVGTLFTACGEAMPARKRWLGWSADCRGGLLVDAGAREAIVGRGSSLLAAGIRAVEGSFTSGDLVSLTVFDPEATVPDAAFARGLVNYNADDVRRIAGLKTEQIGEVLGTFPYDEVIHRDNLSVIRRSPQPVSTLNESVAGPPDTPA